MSTKKGVVKIEGYFGLNTDILNWKTVGHLNDLHNLFENLEEKIVIPRLSVFLYFAVTILLFFIGIFVIFV